MPRQVHARHLQPEPVGHRPVEHRQADRDARLAVDHLVEVAVPRVVVVVGVAPEPLLDEQDPVDLPQHVPRLRDRRAAVADAGRQRVDRRQVAAGVDVRVGVARDLQRDPDQVGPRVPPQQATELRAVGERRSHPGELLGRSSDGEISPQRTQRATESKDWIFKSFSLSLWPSVSSVAQLGLLLKDTQPRRAGQSRRPRVRLVRVAICRRIGGHGGPVRVGPDHDAPTPRRRIPRCHDAPPCPCRAARACRRRRRWPWRWSRSAPASSPRPTPSRRGPPTGSPGRPARTCSCTRTTRSTGIPGAPRRSPRPRPRRSRSSCRSATRRATGATSWSASGSRTPRSPSC